MCESSVFLEDRGEVREVMKDVSRILIDGDDAVCIDILGEQTVVHGVRLKEANLLSHGLVFSRI